MNLQFDLQRSDGRLPKRFCEEPLPSGHQPDRIVRDLDRMVAECYALRGLATERATTPATLAAPVLPASEHYSEV